MSPAAIVLGVVTIAEALVGAYQDSPDRAAMLVTLRGLHRQ
jgi:hypothetical protein